MTNYQDIIGNREVDLQNGAPLETHRKEWEETMKDIDNFLQSTQAKHD